MARSLIWMQGSSDPGWACSDCAWKFPIPTLLTSEEARRAYDRLASNEFRKHVCESEAVKIESKPSDEPTFADRASKLIKVGYKPKDAAELIMQEILLEKGGDPKIREKAQVDAEDFLLKVRKGLI